MAYYILAILIVRSKVGTNSFAFHRSLLTEMENRTPSSPSDDFALGLGHTL